MHKLPSNRAALVRLGSLALILAVTSLVGYRLGWFDYRHTLEHVQRIRRAHSFLVFAIGFVIVFGLGTSIGVPAMPFTVAAGALFGTLGGTVLSWVGSMIGAASGYLIARTVGHDVVLRWVKRFPKVNGAVVESRDFAGMLRLRLIPMIPLGTVNFVGGLAKAPFGAYLGATALGVIPSTIIYNYFADSLLEGVGTGQKDAWISLGIASALLLLLSLTPKLFRKREEQLIAGLSAPVDSLHSPRSTAGVVSSRS